MGGEKECLVIILRESRNVTVLLSYCLLLEGLMFALSL